MYQYADAYAAVCGHICRSMRTGHVGVCGHNVGGYGDHKIDEKRHDLHMNKRRFHFRPVTEGGFAEGVPERRISMSLPI